MSFDADLTACAALVEKADPDRFAAAMASPVSARRVLFPLYALNVEASRAPWVTQETMIAEMRLQWWRDALDEIAQHKPARRHEVVTPLSEILDATSAALLETGVAARRWDIYKDPFEDAAHFDAYLRQTAGHLMWVSARTLGAPETARDSVLAFGAATGLVRFLQAIPELEARGRVPLLDGTEAGVRALAQSSLASAKATLMELRTLPKPAACALIEAFQTCALLTKVAKDPGCVGRGQLVLNPAYRSWLLWRAS